MKSRRLTLVAAAAIALVLLARMTSYTVHDTEVAVVLTFGEPTREDAEPGLGLKWPAPIQTVRTFDRRLRVLKAPLEEMTTRDQRAILVGTFLLWRVSSAKTFLERVGEPAAAERLLRTSLRNHQAAAIGAVEFGQLVSADPSQLALSAVEERILAGVRADVRAHGVEIAAAGVRRLGLPKAATEAVFARMAADRRKLATETLERGRREAALIETEAERRRDELLAAARVEARELLTQAEEDARPHLQALSADPDLAVFLEKLDALEQLLERKEGRPAPTLVLDTDDPPFDLLRPEATAPSEPAAPGERR